MKKSIKIFNFIMLIAIIIADIFYIINGTLILKSTTSALFVLLGSVNLIYALLSHTTKRNFAIIMLIGLIFAMCGDIFLEINFIIGAILFAIGHIMFFVAYSTLIKFKVKDLLYVALIFVPAMLVIVLAPIFNFGSIIMEILCISYALVISLMVGKSIANFIRSKSRLNLIILSGSILFIFSDLMLLFHVFSSISIVFGILCLASYYPAEFLLAYSIYRSVDNK